MVPDHSRTCSPGADQPARGRGWLIVVGPVFPHEVVGFSGGHTYFSPWSLRPGADRLVVGWVR